MSTKTENYQLTMWDFGDEKLRSGLNENFAKLDGALVMGSYRGSKNSESNFQVIDLGFTPRAVFVWSEKGLCVDSGYNYAGIAMGPKGAPEAATKHSSYIYVIEGGFRVKAESIGNLNNSNLSSFLLKNLELSGISACQTLKPYVLSLVFSLTG